MKMIPLKKEQFSCLLPLLEARIVEANLQERAVVAHGMKTMENGYDNRNMGVYTDSVESPSCCLVISHFPGAFSPDLVAFIHVLYVTPEKRGDLALSKALLTAAEVYAKANGARTLYGSSWIYRDSQGTDAFWKRNKFEIQESTYVKILTD